MAKTIYLKKVVIEQILKKINDNFSIFFKVLRGWRSEDLQSGDLEDNHARWRKNLSENVHLRSGELEKKAE